jgi:hypothetical protein
MMMRTRIKQILRESDFDWISDLPAEDDVVYLNLTVGEPDLDDMPDEDDPDWDMHEPEWKYWNLYLYVPKHVYRDITGQDDLNGEFDEWNISEREGYEFLMYFEMEGDFKQKQKHGVSTHVTVDDNDASFTVIDKKVFCSEVGSLHPDRCGNQDLGVRSQIKRT